MVEDTDQPACSPQAPSQLVLASQLDNQSALSREQEEEELSKELASFIHARPPQSRHLPGAFQLSEWMKDEEVSDEDQQLPLLFIEEDSEEEQDGGRLTHTHPKMIQPFRDPQTTMRTDGQQKEERTPEHLEKRCAQLQNKGHPWIESCTEQPQHPIRTKYFVKYQKHSEPELELDVDERPSSEEYIVKGNDTYAKYENKVKSPKNTIKSLTDREHEPHQPSMEQYDQYRTQAGILQKKDSFRPLMEQPHVEQESEAGEVQADQSHAGPLQYFSMASSALAPPSSSSSIPKPTLTSPSPSPSSPPPPALSRPRPEMPSPRSKPFQREVGVVGKPPRSPVLSRRLCPSPPRGHLHSPAPRVQRPAFSQDSLQSGGEPFKVLYNYHPHNEDEVELKEGDLIDVMEQCDDGWFVGTSRRSRFFGTFPGNYVRRM